MHYWWDRGSLGVSNIEDAVIQALDDCKLTLKNTVKTSQKRPFDATVNKRFNTAQLYCIILCIIGGTEAWALEI
jgi:hypothetical protein